MVRLGAIVAGALGVAAAIAGAVGLVAKPDAIVWASAPLDRPVVVIPPQVLAMDGVLDIVVEGEPYTEIRTAQTVDVYAWLRGESSIVVRGISSWTEVTLVKPQIYTYDGNEMTGDIWRSNVVRYGAMHIRPADVPSGLAVVVITRSHTPLDQVSIQLRRDPGYEWAWPAVSAGALLAAVSIVLFAIAWLAPAPVSLPQEEAEVAAPTPPRKRRTAKEPAPSEPAQADAAPKESSSEESPSTKRASRKRTSKQAASKPLAPEAPESEQAESEEPPPEKPPSRRARRSPKGEE